MNRIDNQCLKWVCDIFNTDNFKEAFNAKYKYTLEGTHFNNEEDCDLDINAIATNSVTGEPIFIEIKSINRNYSEWKPYSDSGSNKYVFCPSTSAITHYQLSGYTFPSNETIEAHRGNIPPYIEGKKIYMLNASVKGNKHLGGDNCKLIKLMNRNSAIVYIFNDCLLYFDRTDLLNAFLCYAYVQPSNSDGNYELKYIIDLDKSFKYDCSMPSEYFPPKDGYK